MSIVVDEGLKAYIDPLTPEEHDALERSLLKEGCRDALVLWGELLVDGHNRYGICRKHNIPFQTVQSTLFQSLEDVHLWMIDQHLGRRSVSDFQRGVLALRKREILARRQSPAAMEPTTESPDADAAPVAPVTAEAAPIKSREDLARAARLSAAQVVQIEKIQKQAAPEVVAAVKSGVISINAAAAVASLPADEQVVAAQGGKEQLREAAKRVRETKRRTKPEALSAPDTPDTPADAPADSDDVPALKARIAALETEVASLRLQLAAFQG